MTSSQVAIRARLRWSVLLLGAPTSPISSVLTSAKADSRLFCVRRAFRLQRIHWAFPVFRMPTLGILLRKPRVVVTGPVGGGARTKSLVQLSGSYDSALCGGMKVRRMRIACDNKTRESNRG